jgi:hypothetical protein
MGKIRIIEKNNISKNGLISFGEIIAESILEKIGIYECKNLINLYKKSKDK